MATSEVHERDLEKQTFLHSAQPSAVNATSEQEKRARAEMPRSMNLHLLGYRGYISLAVIFVHLHHMEQQDPERSPLHQLAERLRCHRGVALFFIFSSFQLTLNLLEKWPARQLGVRPTLLLWGDYWVRRLFRIYPPFMFVVLVLKVVPEWGRAYFGGSEDGTVNVWRLLTMQEKGAKLASLWTLPPELEYYAIIPVLVTVYKWGEAADARRTGKLNEKKSPAPRWPWAYRATAVAPFALLAIAQPYIYSTSAALADPMMHASLPHFYCVFFSGTAAAIVLYNLNLARRANHLQIPPVQPFESSPSKQPPSDSIRHATVRRRFHLLSSQGWYHWCCQHSKALKGAMNVALWVSFLLRQDSHYLINAEFPRIPDLPYMGLGLTTIFLSSAWPSETKGSFNWVFMSRPLLRIGAISYSLYLWHPIAIHLAYKQGFRWPASIPVTYAIALAFGAFGQRFIEAPFVRIGSLAAKQLARVMSGPSLMSRVSNSQVDSR